MIEPERPDDSIIWCTRYAGWITETTNTHSEYVISIAIPLQQGLREISPILRHITLPILFNNNCTYGNISWPPLSPDPSDYGFLLWGCLKSIVF